MRKPRPEAFDPNATRRHIDAIDLSGIVPLHALENPTPIQSAPAKAKPQPVVTRHRDTTIPSNHDTVIPRHHDTTAASSSSLFQLVRKAVKEFGKEAATHRFTQAEKQAIAEVVYGYRTKGIRTSENEIARIAINYLVQDYRLHSEKSILHQCLLALNE